MGYKLANIVERHVERRCEVILSGLVRNGCVQIEAREYRLRYERSVLNSFAEVTRTRLVHLVAIEL